MPKSTINGAAEKISNKVKATILAGKLTTNYLNDFMDIGQGIYWASNYQQYMAYGDMETKWALLPEWAIPHVAEIVNIHRTKIEQSKLEYAHALAGGIATRASSFAKNAGSILKKSLYTDVDNTIDAIKNYQEIIPYAKMGINIAQSSWLDRYFVSSHWAANPVDYECFGHEKCAWICIPNELEQEILSYIDPTYFSKSEARRVKLLNDPSALQREKAKIQQQINELDKQYKKINTQHKTLIKTNSKMALKESLSEKEANKMNEDLNKIAEAELALAKIKESKLQLMESLKDYKKGIIPYQEAFEHYVAAEKSIEKLKSIDTQQQQAAIKDTEEMIKLLHKGIASNEPGQEKLIELYANKQLTLESLRERFPTRQEILNKVQQLAKNKWENININQEMLKKQFDKDNPLEHYRNFKYALLKAAKSGNELSKIDIALFQMGYAPYPVPDHFMEQNYHQAKETLESIKNQTSNPIAKDRANIGLAILKIIEQPNEDVYKELATLVKFSMASRDLTAHQWAKDFLNSPLIENLPLKSKDQLIQLQAKEEARHEKATDIKLKLQEQAKIAHAHEQKSRKTFWQKIKKLISPSSEKTDDETINIEKINDKSVASLETYEVKNQAIELNAMLLTAENETQTAYFELEYFKALKNIGDTSVEVKSQQATCQHYLEKTEAIRNALNIVKNELQKRINTLEEPDNKIETAAKALYVPISREVKINYEAMPLPELKESCNNKWRQHITATKNIQTIENELNSLTNAATAWKAYQRKNFIMRLFSAKPKIKNPQPKEINAKKHELSNAQITAKRILRDAKTAQTTYHHRQKNKARDLGSMPLVKLTKLMKEAKQEIEANHIAELSFKRELDNLTSPLASYFSVDNAEIKTAEENWQNAAEASKATLERAQHGYEILHKRALREAADLPLESLKSYMDELDNEHIHAYRLYEAKQEELNTLKQQKNSWLGTFFMGPVPTDEEIAEAEAKVKAAKFLSDRTVEIAESVGMVYQKLNTNLSENQILKLGSLIQPSNTPENDNNIFTDNNIRTLLHTQDMQAAQNAHKLLENVEQVLDALDSTNQAVSPIDIRKKGG